jgi:hypothetical protein
VGGGSGELARKKQFPYPDYGGLHLTTFEADV